jgi:hypothetical protein
LGEVFAEDYTPAEKGGGRVEGVTVLEGDLDSVEIEASTSGGGYFTDDIILEVGTKDTKESENLVVLEEAFLD